MTNTAEIGGTFKCPICGLDEPHQHPETVIRWHKNHLPLFIEKAATLLDGHAHFGYKVDGDDIIFIHNEVRALWRIYQGGTAALGMLQKSHALVLKK